MSSYPVLLHIAIDASDCRALTEFYRNSSVCGIERERSRHRMAAPTTLTGWSSLTTTATES